MKNLLKTCALGACLFVAVAASGQSKKELAQQKCDQAISLMDKGEFEASFQLLNEAKKLDPANLNLEYETAFAYNLQKDFKQAIKTMEAIKGKKDFAANYYGLLGSSYDYDGQFSKAISTFDEGLKKFPKSGALYLEKGVAYLGQKEYNKALDIFEKGIEIEPTFPSNYYWASKLWLSTENEIWGMIYGELFMNLEPNSRRTAEISKLLFNTYKSEIKFTSDTSMSVSFARNTLRVTKKPTDKELEAALYPTILEADLLMAVAFEKAIDLPALDRIRQNFVKIYYEKNHQKTYPNVLFDFQKKLLENQQLEAYNYWLLMKGDEPAFVAWREANESKWEKFREWFGQNQLELTAKNRFQRPNTSL